MSLGALLSTVAPFLCDTYVKSQVAGARQEGVTDALELSKVEDDAREHAITLVHTAEAAIAAHEAAQRKSSSHFVAHLAADLMRGWPGEPTHEAAKAAVAIAKTIVDEAERLSKPPPARSASAP